MGISSIFVANAGREVTAQPQTKNVISTTDKSDTVWQATRSFSLRVMTVSWLHQNESSKRARLC